MQNPLWIPVVMLAVGLSGASAAPAVVVMLPNAGFEQAGAGGFPEGWHPYNWGPEHSIGKSERSLAHAHQGAASLLADSRDGAARPGAYTRVPLDPGRYALRFFARAEEGRTALVRAYLADRYSPPFVVGDRWTQITYEHGISKRRLRAEVNVQHFGGEAGVVWFDDVELAALPDVKMEIVTDIRPAAKQPKLLYFSGNLNHVRRTATDWARRGFSGFFFAHIMHDWASNVWAQDGDAATVGAQDALLQEARTALGDSAAAGLNHNALKVALYSELPDPFDDAAYRTLTENFRQGARFAREAGFPLIAIDTEYVADQYDYSWEGYDLETHARDKLARRLRLRWREVGRAIAAEHPTAEIGILPEGMLYYGPLWLEVFGGLLEGLKSGGSRGDVHVFCEGAYSLTDPHEIREHAETVRATTRALLTGDARAFWNRRGKIALGAWPLGYYRAIKDDKGAFLGWSGKRETFGDRIVGSYADKSERYPLDEFRVQLAAIRTFSDRYCWIYGHGSTWWQVSDEHADSYAAKVHRFPRDNYLLPTTPNIEEYYGAAAEQNVVRPQGAGPR